MARIAGRNGRAYMSLTSGGTAEPVAFLNSWSLNFTSERFDVTSFGDTGKAYVAGLPDATGDLAGFYDDASAQMYTAAVDGVARKFYLYPSTNLNTQYFFGTVFADMSIDGSVDGPVSISGSWSAATPITKVG